MGASSTSNVVFRVDAYRQIGFGHLSRCLALADGLARRDRSSTFVVGPRSQVVAPRIEGAGYPVEVMPPIDSPRSEELARSEERRWLDVDWSVDATRFLEVIGDREVDCVIVDQYGLDARWERFVSDALGAEVVVIDGVANRSHDCAVLVDPTYRDESTTQRWHSRLSPGTRVVSGVKYAMLRPEFGRALRESTATTAVDEVLIAFGGSDEVGATEMALEAVVGLGEKRPSVTVVAGALKPAVDELRRRCRALDDVEFYFDTDRMPELMASADVAVGGAGTMMWERAFVGLPALVVAIAVHQQEIAEQVEVTGAIDYLGDYADVTVTALRGAIERLVDSPQKLHSMRQASRAMMDNATEVGTEQVADIVRQLME